MRRAKWSVGGTFTPLPQTEAEILAYCAEDLDQLMRYDLDVYLTGVGVTAEKRTWRPCWRNLRPPLQLARDRLARPPSVRTVDAMRRFLGMLTLLPLLVLAGCGTETSECHNGWTGKAPGLGNYGVVCTHSGGGPDLVTILLWVVVVGFALFLIVAFLGWLMEQGSSSQPNRAGGPAPATPAAASPAAPAAVSHKRGAEFRVGEAFFVPEDGIWAVITAIELGADSTLLLRCTTGGTEYRFQVQAGAMYPTKP